MRIPTMRGVIDRRILANFHIDPDVLANVLPSPFRPKLVNGKGIAGICLIRLKHIRPRFVPSYLGLSSENAAHRIAVEWNQNGQKYEGVYVPRRDTSSRLNTLVGGRIFSGVQHHARFTAEELGDNYSVIMDSDDGAAHVAVEGHLTDLLPNESVFGSVQDASDFFKYGSLGYSDTRTSGSYDGLELHTDNWNVEPLAIDRVESSFFEDGSLFPAGTVEFDCALLMRNIEHEWRGQPTLCADSTTVPVDSCLTDR